MPPAEVPYAGVIGCLYRQNRSRSLWVYAQALQIASKLGEQYMQVLHMIPQLRILDGMDTVRLASQQPECGNSAATGLNQPPSRFNIGPSKAVAALPSWALQVPPATFACFIHSMDKTFLTCIRDTQQAETSLLSAPIPA